MLLSKEHILYLKNIKRNKIFVIITQVLMFLSLLFIWELLAKNNLINTFITSSPSLVSKTIINLFKENDLFNHIWVTIYETIISFTLSIIIGIVIASILWWNKFICKVIDPYLTIINSLPKISLGPILIIWVGANTKSIILMALLISSIISIVTILNGFLNIEESKIKLMKSLNASKWQIYKMLIFKGNINTIISSLKINISMCLTGVIMGELLVSKEGIGYLIMYGSQVFNLNLVITGIFILCIVATLMYYIVFYTEKKLIKYD